MIIGFFLSKCKPAGMLLRGVLIVAYLKSLFGFIYGSRLLRNPKKPKQKPRTYLDVNIVVVS